jgi:glycosyltransferase involved in cell wall biosynthesis
MLLSIIIPVYNEERSIATLVERVLDVDFSALSLTRELIVVNDASADNTLGVLKTTFTDGAVRIFSHKKNLGKGAAVQTGIAEARGNIIVIQDADLEYNPQELLKLLTPIVDGSADAVFGSRFAGGEAHRVLYFWHYVGNRILTLLSNICSNLNLTDMEVCYKAFRAEVARSISLQEKRFGFEPEITAKLARLSREGKCRIFEVGISYSGRTYAEGKKISWKDGVSAARCIIKYNLFKK